MNRNMKNSWMFTKKAVGALINGLAEGLYKVIEIRASTSPIMSSTGDATWSKDVFIIDADVAKELKWMSPDQLRAMFNGRKVKTSPDPDVWKSLKWMSPDQLNAVFGNGGPNK